nr:hypothetical protein [Tanacetum cinerariifolium]
MSQIKAEGGARHLKDIYKKWEESYKNHSHQHEKAPKKINKLIMHPGIDVDFVDQLVDEKGNSKNYFCNLQCVYLLQTLGAMGAHHFQLFYGQTIKSGTLTFSFEGRRRKRVISSPNHPTFDIEDAFSSPNYTPASPDYSPASSGNTPSESLNNSYGLVPMTSPTPSVFHDDPYMKVMHAYDAIIPPKVHILPPVIVPPSLMLSLIFNPQEFFVPEELLPPKKQTRFPSISSNDLSNLSRKQACILVPPSFLAYTPTPPQIFKIGKISIKMHLKHHEKQIEDILNYLEELSFHRIEKIEERLVNGWMILQRDFDELKTKLEKVRS